MRVEEFEETLGFRLDAASHEGIDSLSGLFTASLAGFP